MAEKSGHLEVIIASTIYNIFGCLSPSDPDNSHMPSSAFDAAAAYTSNAPSLNKVSNALKLEVD